MIGPGGEELSTYRGRCDVLFEARRPRFEHLATQKEVAPTENIGYARLNDDLHRLLLKTSDRASAEQAYRRYCRALLGTRSVLPGLGNPRVVRGHYGIDAFLVVAFCRRLRRVFRYARVEFIHREKRETPCQNHSVAPVQLLLYELT